MRLLRRRRRVPIVAIFHDPPWYVVYHGRREIGRAHVDRPREAIELARTVLAGHRFGDDA
jgi:hypothetical protein